MPTTAMLTSTEGVARADSGSIRPLVRFVGLSGGQMSCGLGELCNDGKKSVGGEKERVVWFRDTVHSADSLG